MGYYPICVDMEGKRAVVIGGGEVAFRKVSALLRAGAVVTVVSPRLTDGLKGLLADGSIKHLRRRYVLGDLAGAFLAVSASSSSSVNLKVAEEATELAMLVNVATDLERSNFLVPAVVERGPLKIAVSTSGLSPFVAKGLKEDLEATYGPEYGEFVRLLGTVRSKLLNEKRKNVKNDTLFRALAHSPIPEWIKIGALDRIDDFLKVLLGPGYSLKKLGIKL